MADAVRVRPPLPSDAAALAGLAAELGYPTSSEALLGRLAALHPTDAAGARIGSMRAKGTW